MTDNPSSVLRSSASTEVTLPTGEPRLYSAEPQCQRWRQRRCTCHGNEHVLAQEATITAVAASASTRKVPSQAQTHERVAAVALFGTKVLLRLCGAGAVLLVLSVLSFVLTALSPGDAALNTLQPLGVTSPEIINSVRECLGLNSPVLLQYLNWLYNLVSDGSLGASSHYGRAVSTVMLTASTVSLKLCALSLLLLVVISLPLGIFCALHPRSLIDKVLHVASLVLLSIPSFLLCLVLLYFAGVKMGLITTLRPESITDYLTSALCLALPLAAYYVQQIREAVLSELRAPYLVALKSRGISLRVRLFKHVLPRALIALLPLLAISIGHVLCGTVVIESIFSMQGLGYIALQAISFRDLNLIQAYVLYSAVIFMALNATVNALTTYLSRTALSEAQTC